MHHPKDDLRRHAGERRRGVLNSTCAIGAVTFLMAFGAAGIAGQAPNPETVIRGIDAAVYTRYDNVLGFTAIERYSVFKGNDETHPVAEMTVKDNYTKGVGKTYTVLSRTGSGFVMKIGLEPLLENEKIINLPGNLQQSWFTSANYTMNLSGTERLDGRTCLRLAVQARHKARNTIDGTIWVDAKNDTLIQIQGVATKDPSAFAGATHLMRQYVEIQGYSMAKHARAESSSIVGRIVVTIDYSDYHLQLRQ